MPAITIASSAARAPDPSVRTRKRRARFFRGFLSRGTVFIDLPIAIRRIIIPFSSPGRTTWQRPEDEWKTPEPTGVGTHGFGNEPLFRNLRERVSYLAGMLATLNP